MGLLSKLFGGDKDAEKAAKDLLQGIFGSSGQTASSGAPSQGNAAPATRTEAGTPHAAPSGVSYGEEMPAEENQYNYPGSFTEYFESVFRSDFPEYRVEKSRIGSKRIVYTFFGERKALVVEVRSSSSEAYKLRADCQKEGVPYLRFYYDHPGWWNTRSYVSQRIFAALRG